MPEGCYQSADRRLHLTLRQVEGWKRAPACKGFPALFLGLMLLGSNASSSAQNGPEPDPTQAQSTNTSSFCSSKTVVPFTTREHFRFYERTTFAPFAFAGPIAGAALSQWVTGSPREWGQGFPGYGRRVLSGYSRQVAANTIGLGLAFLDGEDPRHYMTGQRGIWRRGVYAARQAFVSHRMSGGEMPAYSRIIGAYAASFVANAWYPARESNTRYALYRGSTALASGIVWHVFREFWPDIDHKFRKRR